MHNCIHRVHGIADYIDSHLGFCLSEDEEWLQTISAWNLMINQRCLIKEVIMQVALTVLQHTGLANDTTSIRNEAYKILTASMSLCLAKICPLSQYSPTIAISQNEAY